MRRWWCYNWVTDIPCWKMDWQYFFVTTSGVWESIFVSSQYSWPIHKGKAKSVQKFRCLQLHWFVVFNMTTMIIIYSGWGSNCLLLWCWVNVHWRQKWEWHRWLTQLNLGLCDKDRNHSYWTLHNGERFTKTELTHACNLIMLII